MSFLHSLEKSVHDAAESAIKKHGSQILDKAKEIAMDQGKEYIKKKFGGEAEESGEEKTGAEATTTAQDSEKGEKKEENSYDEMKRSHHHHHHERHSNQNESTQSYEDNYTETNYQTNQQYNVNVKERVGEINSQKSYQSYVPQSQTAPQSQSSSNGQSEEQGAKPQTSSTTSTASANNASQDNHPLSASQTKPAVPASKPDPTSSLLDLEIKAVQALTGQKDDKPGTAQAGGKEPEKTNTTKDAIIGLVTSQMKTNEQLKLFNQTLLKDEAKEEKNLKAATDKGMLVDEFEISFQRDLQQQKGCFAATLEKILSLLNSK